MSKKVELELNCLFGQYEMRAFEIAEREFNRVVAPYCKKYGLTFLSGNGTFFFFRIADNGKTISYNDRLPMHVRNTVDLEVPGLPANSLGTIMPDYDTNNHTEGD